MIAHIVLNVSNFERSEAFYDKLLLPLGFSVDHREETVDFSVKSYENGSHNIWIKCENAAEHALFVRDVGLNHLAFRARSTAEVERIHNDLQAAGVEITRPPAAYPEYSPEYYAFYFRDPDGIPLEIVYY